MVRAARTCLDYGARSVIACAAHGLFAHGADAAMRDPALSAILITDTVAPDRLGASLARGRSSVRRRISPPCSRR